MQPTIDPMNLRTQVGSDGRVPVWDPHREPKPPYPEGHPLNGKLGAWYRTDPINARQAVERGTAFFAAPEGAPPPPTAKQLGPAPPSFEGRQSPLAPVRDIAKTGVVGSVKVEPTNDGSGAPTAGMEAPEPVEAYEEPDVEPPAGEE